MSNTPETKLPKNKVKLELKRLASRFKELHHKFLDVNLKLNDPNTKESELVSLNKQMIEVHAELTRMHTLATEYTQMLSKTGFENMRVPDQLAYLLKHPEFDRIKVIFGADPKVSLELLPINEFMKIVNWNEFPDNNAVNILEQTAPESFDTANFTIAGGTLAMLKSNHPFTFIQNTTMKDIHTWIFKSGIKYFPDLRFIFWALENQESDNMNIRMLKMYLINEGDRILIPGCTLTSKEDSSYFLLSLVYAKDTQKIELELIKASELVTEADTIWSVFVDSKEKS